MKISDAVYGEIEITEPVLLELVESSAMQRLKGVDMGGHYEVYFPNSKHSRFEHSVGVAWLLKRFGASLEEQVAGLLHDVSHSAFSHAIDYAVSSATQATQSYQDDIHEEYVLKTEIPAILKKYDFLVEDILDDTRHPLKENNLPDLCADRIDYILRGGIAHRDLSFDEAQVFLDNFVIIDSRWVFKSYQVAREFAELFRFINHRYYSNIETALMFRTTGDWLAHALNHNYISLTELYSTDKEVIQKVNKHVSDDPQLQKLWRRMNNESKHHLDAAAADRVICCKSRMVDPFCLNNGALQRVSDIDQEWGSIVQEESKPKEYKIVFED